MRFTLTGLILAMLFGVFLGSEGQVESTLFNLIFWGLIGGGAFLNLLDILRERVCRHCECRFCASN